MGETRGDQRYAAFATRVAEFLTGSAKSEASQWRHFEAPNRTFAMTSSGYERELPSGARVVLTRRVVSDGMSRMYPTTTYRLEILDTLDDLVACREDGGAELTRLWVAVEAAHIERTEAVRRAIFDDLAG